LSKLLVWLKQRFQKLPDIKVTELPEHLKDQMPGVIGVLTTSNLPLSLEEALGLVKKTDKDVIIESVSNRD
jgi:hypothetical protein